MTDDETVTQAIADNRPTARRPYVLGVAAVALIALSFALGGYGLASSQQSESDALGVARRVASKAQALEAQVRSLGEKPVVDVPAPGQLPEQVQQGPADIIAEIQNPELQQAERQQPERQQQERQNRELQDPEVNNQERQEAERQDPEIDDPDPDDPEIQDPEINDPDPNDPDPDDPDPNSALDFQVDDQCNPPAGEFVTDVGASWQRGPGVVTLVLTCTSAAAPAQP